MSEQTAATRDFIASLKEGSWYVLSREDQGFCLGGEAAAEARRLTKANFDRLAQMEAAAKSSSAEGIRLLTALRAKREFTRPDEPPR